MDQNRCDELRDLLFSQKFEYPEKGFSENRFRFMAVLPDQTGMHDATVHFSFDSPVWERAGVPSDVFDVVEHVQNSILGSDLSSRPVGIVHHHHLRDGWPLPWAITARADRHNFPVIVALENSDLSISGAVMRNPRFANSEYRIADGYAELPEVYALIDRLRYADKNALVEGLYKEAAIDAPRLEDAITQAPKSRNGQLMVILYREEEWLSGIWNPPSMGLDVPLTLGRISAHLNCRASAAKLAERPVLEIARNGQTVPGDYELLLKVAAQVQADASRRDGIYELNPGVIHLCDWWNRVAPDVHQSASVFSLYHWEENNKVFVPCYDNGLPPMTAEQIAKVPSYSLFELPGRPTFAAVFYRGKKFNKECSLGTEVFFADGQLAFEIGLRPVEVDEAYNSVCGLETLAQVWGSLMPA